MKESFILKHGYVCLLIILIIFSRAVTAVETTPRISICLGEGLGEEWDLKATRLVKEVLKEFTESLDIIIVPAKRAEFTFQYERCNAFFAGPTNLEFLIERNNIFKIDNVILEVNLVVYSGAQNEELKNLTKLNDKYEYLNKSGHAIGYFDSISMHKFMGSFDKAAVVGFGNMSRGLLMLQKERVDFVILPELLNTFPDKFADQKDSIYKLVILQTVPLYLWLDNSFMPQKEAIEQKVNDLKSSEQWRLLLSPNHLRAE